MATDDAPSDKIADLGDIDDPPQAVQDLADLSPTENYADEMAGLLTLLASIINNSDSRRVELNESLPGAKAIYVTEEGEPDPTEKDGDIWFQYSP
jgi:hypothetical protein